MGLQDQTSELQKRKGTIKLFNSKLKIWYTIHQNGYVRRGIIAGHYGSSTEPQFAPIKQIEPLMDKEDYNKAFELVINNINLSIRKTDKKEWALKEKLKVFNTIFNGSIDRWQWANKKFGSSPFFFKIYQWAGK